MILGDVVVTLMICDEHGDTEVDIPLSKKKAKELDKAMQNGGDVEVFVEGIEV